jgi:hypothetical protein
MKIQNSRLKDYIDRNTDSRTRLRSNTIVVKTLEVSEDNQSVKAKVKGSKFYEVCFYGLKDGMISSSCTCPFDWGNVCKHEVAVAKEIDVFLNDTGKISTALKTAKVKENKPAKNDGIFEFSFEEVKNLTKSTLLKYSDLKTIDQGNLSFVENISIAKSTMLLEIHGDYYWGGGIRYKTSIDILADSIKLVSNCRCKKHRLCKHQSSALLYLHQYLSHLFINKEELEQKKEELLSEYGFTLKDKKYQEYFSFDNSEKGLEIIPLKEGIMKKFEFSDFDYFSDRVLSEETTFRDQLPYLNTQNKNTKPQGVAFAFEFILLDDDRRPNVVLYPLTGNLNKDSTELSSKIETIDADDFLFNKEKFRKEERNLIEHSFFLTEDYLDSINSRTFLSSNYIHNKLKELIPKLKNQIVYKWEDNYNKKVSKNYLTPIHLSLNSANLEFIVSEEEDFYITEAYIIIEDEKQKLRNAKIGYNFLFVEKNNKYYLNKSIDFSKTLYFFREQPIFRTIKSDFDNFYNKILAPLEEKHKITINHKKKNQNKIKPTNFKKQIYLSEVDDFIVLKSFIEYDKEQISLFSKKEFTKTENGDTTLILRDEAFEQQFETELRAAHVEFKNQQTDFFFLSQE